jgi:hypothetical protein
VAAAPAPAATPPTTEAAAPPPSPEALATLLEAVSRVGGVRRWLALADPLERLAVVADNLAEGASPRRALRPFAPGKPFEVEERDGRTVMGAAGYGRYDAFGDAVASLDVGAAVRAYRAVHAALQAAYRALGYPEATLDEVVARALGRLASAPVMDGPVEVRPAPEGLNVLFADPALERLPAVEKHLLRMGPRNTRLIQAKARSLLAALALKAPPPAR